MEKKPKTGREFLGQGIAYPFTVNSENKFLMNSYDSQVMQSILLIMRTAKGERIMRPEFGAGLNKMVFEPNNPATIAILGHEVRDALTKFEPRIDIVNIKVKSDGNSNERINIHLEYKVRRTDTMFNLVYPFYLERGEI